MPKPSLKSLLERSDGATLAQLDKLYPAQIRALVAFRPQDFMFSLDGRQNSKGHYVWVRLWLPGEQPFPFTEELKREPEYRLRLRDSD